MPPKFDPTEVKQGNYNIYIKILIWKNDGIDLEYGKRVMFFNFSYLIVLIIFKFFYFTVYLRCVGGEIGATSSLAPKIGPLGLVIIITYLNSLFMFLYTRVTVK